MLIEGERIARVTEPGEATADDEIDARGCIVLPGAVDAHVHVGLDYRLMDGGVATSADRYDDASRAAAAGGTTTIIDFAMQVEGEGLLAPLERRLSDIRASAVDVALHCWMLEANREALRRDPRARRARRAVAQGLPGLQPARRADGGGGPARGLEGRRGGRRDHAGALRELADHPPAARGRAWRAARRATPASRPRARPSPRPTRSAVRSRSPPPAAPRPTASTSRRAARSSICASRACTGSTVHGECCPHHLLLDESRYLGERPGDFVMSPPLRTAEHRAALWAGLVDGTLEVVAADHAAWPAPIKAPGPGFLEAVHGAAGNGLLLPLMAAQVGRVDGLRLGARRAPDGREPGAHLPPPRQGRASRPASTPISSSCTPATSRPCRRCRPTGRSTTASSATSRTCRRAPSCSAAARSRATGSSPASRQRAASSRAHCNANGGMRDYREHSNWRS